MKNKLYNLKTNCSERIQTINVLIKHIYVTRFQYTKTVKHLLYAKRA